MSWAAAAWLVLAVPTPASAQHAPHASAAVSGWTWHVAAQAFLDGNIQVRKFTDFYDVESQNWVMADVDRRVGRGHFAMRGMASFENWTLPLYGSPQVFQTGETHDGAALTDYQHPHDLVMAAAARFDWPVSTWRLIVGGGAVDAPAVGPAPFMHRASAEPNPTAPLGHHTQDSTHIAHGVLTLGVAKGNWMVETSGFHGREPDEDRVAVEFGPIDSYAARVTWQRSAWHVQASGAFLNYPNPTEATDAVLMTGSASYAPAGRPLAVTLVCGVSREIALDVTQPSCLAEGVWRRPRDLWYGRLEVLKKDILTQGGYDPPGFPHQHVLSAIVAFTAGVERRLFESRAGRFGLGADATIYWRDPNLADNYGWPFSAHIFLRYRFTRGSAGGEMKH